jgi:hypothetical protein
VHHHTAHSARNRRSLTALFGLVALGMLLSACAGSSPQASSPSSTKATPRTSVPPGSTVVSGASTTTTAVVQANMSPCAADSLQVTMVNAVGAGGTGYYRFQARNISATGCDAGGYFGVSVYDQSGNLVTSHDLRQATSPDGAVLRPLSLPPGAALLFEVGVGETPTGTQTTCPEIGAFHLIPPNETAYDQVAIPAGQNRLDCDPLSLAVGPTQPLGGN